MRTLLGISAFYHDSAAVLLRDGTIVAAAEEERFTRKKHDGSLPENAIAYCMEEGGISARDVDLVCYYEKPLRKLERILDTFTRHAPRGFSAFRRAMPSWMSEKLFVGEALTAGALSAYRGRIGYPSHHESHAASAFYPSPFERAAIITCDGVGEWATTTWGIGEGRDIRLEESLSFPHSLGLLYSAFTDFVGFKVNSGEYKLMGLAPYGKPVYEALIRRELIDVRDDGSFRLSQRYFTYAHSLTMTGARFAALFDGPRRAPESPLTEREANIAASVQAVLEDVLLRMGRHVHARTGATKLCLAGGVALNCVANGRLRREGPFESIWVQPAAGDAGAALGAALFGWHALLGRPREPDAADSMRGCALGPRYDDADVEVALRAVGATFTRVDDEDARLDTTCAMLEAGEVVGWFQGRMELGPRALGARSILADARHDGMQDILNARIKLRESFRPFAPAVLAERVEAFFDVPPGFDSPYMLFAERVHASGARPLDLPATTHVDGSARIQTVSAARHPRLHALLSRFDARTGCPVLVNTSFNVRGEPIVMTPADALACFFVTDMDALVIEGFVLRKDAQPAALVASERASAKRFALD